MSAIISHAMDSVLHLSVSPATRGRREVAFDPDYDRAPGMPLLGFVIAIVLSAPLWAIIGVTAWTLLT